MRPSPLKARLPVALQRSSISCGSVVPRFPQPRRQYPFLGAVRYIGLEAGENKSGHISAGPNEGILFFDSVFPLRLQWLLRLPWQAEGSLPGIMKKVPDSASGIAAADPASIIAQASKDKISIKTLEVLPRLKEGGAFVKFSHDGSVPAEEIENTLRSHLREHQIRPWWNPFGRVRTSLVRGKPWVEDLYRLPTSTLKVEFLPPSPGEPAAELSQEQLYSFFRPYGKLSDITPQPSDSKILPRYAIVEFASKTRAIMAKNCMHGYLVPEAEGGGKLGTVLRLTYEKKAKAHWIRDWLTNHPRIVIPAVAALIAGISVVIFDPLRTFFVKAHITRQFHLTDNKIVRWVISWAEDLISFRHYEDDAGMEAIWDDRKANIEQIRTWLMETTDTFIIVQGPRGSGKKELVVDQALKHRRNMLVIDCKPIQEARGDSATINAAAQQVGYRPIFSWMNSISGMVDLVAQGAAGVKTGFSETLDSQLTKIWNTTAVALKQIALDNRKKDDADSYLGDDEWLEAHPEKRPVIVIDNFLHKSQEDTLVYDKIADWAARVTTANIAHVIFLTTDVSFSKSLSKALPDRVFRQMSLSDCTPEVAKKFVITHIDADPDDVVEDGEGRKITPSQRREDLAELDECLDFLGGRLTDLEFFARRIKTGETPKKAVREMIEQSASEILKMYLYGADSTDRKWTPEQAWMLIEKLSKEEMLRYNEILLSDTFKSTGEKALQALEQAELISIVSYNGRPYCIKPGKPIFQSAFGYLTDDKVLSSKLNLQIYSEMIKIETANIDKYEAELRLLSELKKQPWQLTNRITWLLEKVAASQEKVEKYEKESALLKKILATEY